MDKQTAELQERCAALCAELASQPRVITTSYGMGTLVSMDMKRGTAGVMVDCMHSRRNSLEHFSPSDVRPLSDLQGPLMWLYRSGPQAFAVVDDADFMHRHNLIAKTHGFALLTPKALNEMISAGMVSARTEPEPEPVPENLPTANS